jgi:hypothetical protein
MIGLVSIIVSLAVLGYGSQRGTTLPEDIPMMSQANIPALQPDIQILSPALRKTVGDLQKQCPSCATIDLATGKKLWAGAPPFGQAQVEIVDGCHLATWAHDEAEKLRVSIEKALTADQITEFHSKASKDCEQKAFVYYLEIARQLMPKGSDE